MMVDRVSLSVFSINRQVQGAGITWKIWKWMEK